MSKYIETPAKVENPSWSGRNEKIASHIHIRAKVLDLGCGAKDLLNYIHPFEYLGIDYNDEHADIQMNFNEPFELPKGHWDYIVASGLLEYLVDLEDFFTRVKGHSAHYIFTVWKKFESLDNPHQLATFKEYERLIKNNFRVLETDSWKTHKIYICRDK